MKGCPRCGSVLVEVDFGGMRVDGCHGCGGLWFDRGELAIAARSHAAQLGRMEGEFAPSPTVSQLKTAMACPTCSVKLVEFESPHSPGIKMDGCPKCQGIWLDEGELAGVQRRLAEMKARAAGASPAAAAPAAPAAPRTDARQRARSATAFLLQSPCPGCGQPNPLAAPVCWACGAILKGKRGMLCPRCDKPLKGEVHQGLRLDCCPLCRGVWLDEPEFPALMRKGTQALRSLEAEMGPPLLGLDAQRQTKRTAMCPTCYVPLEQRRYAAVTAIHFDRCPRCDGFWLDTRELGFVAEYVTQDAEFLPER